MVLGTEVDTIPEGMESPGDDNWIDDLEFCGIEVDRENPRARYLAWLQWYAIKNNDDLQRVMAGSRESAGISEEEVDNSVNSFRRAPVRRADNKRKPGRRG